MKQNETLREILNQKLLDENETAEYLKIAPGTLSVWRSVGRHKLPFVKVGRLVRYRQADLDNWIESRVIRGGD